jgi:F0F1-type ATP synthase assembly protein I
LALLIVAGQAAVLAALAAFGFAWSASVSISLAAGAAACLVPSGLACLVAAEWRRQRPSTVMLRMALGTLVKYAATVGVFAVVFTRLEVALPLVLAGWLTTWSAYVWVPLLVQRGNGTR